MDNLADNATESRLVMAVKAAARNLSKNAALNIDEELANQLTAFAVPAGFAKEAAKAANKSLSVHYLTTHSDTDRAQDFALANPSKVASLMGVKSTLQAPSEPSIHVSVQKVASMQKAASMKAQQYPIIYGIPEVDQQLGKSLLAQGCTHNGVLWFSKDGNPITFNGLRITKNANFESKLADGLDKMAKAIEESSMVLAEERRTYSNLLEGIKKQASSKHEHDMSVVLSAYPVLQGVIEDMGYNTSGVVKNASLCILDTPFTMLVKKAALKRLLVQGAEQYHDELCKHAARINRIADAYSHLTKHAAEDDDPYSDDVADVTKLIAHTALEGPIGAVTGAVEGASGGFEKARDMMRAADDKDFSISKGIDASFLQDDRKLDYGSAWADVMADPSLKGYPAGKVDKVFRNVIKSNTNLTSPAQRMLLMENIKRALAQNDSLSIADMAVVNKVMKDYATGPKHIYEGIQGNVVSPEYVDWSNLKASDAVQSLLGNVGGVTKTVLDIGEKRIKRQMAEDKEEAKNVNALAAADLDHYAKEQTRAKEQAVAAAAASQKNKQPSAIDVQRLKQVTADARVSRLRAALANRLAQGKTLNPSEQQLISLLFGRTGAPKPVGAGNPGKPPKKTP